MENSTLASKKPTNPEILSVPNRQNATLSTHTTGFVKIPKSLCALARNRIRGFSTTKDLGDVVGLKTFVRTSRAVSQ
jgi:hypothetical protein